MPVFDLKPLTTETIQDLKIKSDQLWEIKIDENIYGPFETQQLRHYSKENKHALTRAFVSPMSVDNWRPFFEVREFIHSENYSGPYWMLSEGRKSSPLSKEEIAKRIELGTIKRNDEISEDEGRNWYRISSHPEFECYFTTASALPELPLESSFQRSKQKVLEQLENRSQQTDEKESLASLTHVSLARKEKTRTLQLDDIRLPSVESAGPSFWSQYKSYLAWATPVLAITLYFLNSPSAPKKVAEVKNEVKKVETTARTKQVSKKDNWTRTPASSRQEYHSRSPVTQTYPRDDHYPTVIETHHEDQAYPDPSAEADQIAEINEQEERNEEQLLNQQRPEREPADNGESLDATMNNEPMEQPNPAIDVPMVEEISDF